MVSVSLSAFLPSFLRPLRLVVPPHLPKPAGPASPPLTRAELERAAPEVTAVRWTKVAIFRAKMEHVTLEQPTVFATPDGAVCLRWAPALGHELGAEFGADGSYFWASATQDGVFELPCATLERLCECAARALRKAFSE